MPYTKLREWAFQARSAELRNYGAEILTRNPERVAAAEVLDLMAYLVECDFIAAEAKLATIKYKFDGSADQEFIEEAAALAQSHINFAFGRLNPLKTSAETFLANLAAMPNLEQGAPLDIWRLLAQKAVILDEFDEMERIFSEISGYKKEAQSTNFFYLTNSIKALYLLTQGEYIQASEIAMTNIEIAKQNSYQGLMAPVDSYYVLARAKLAGARNQEAMALFEQVKALAEKSAHWPWYFIADGFLSRELAQQNKMAEALEIVRKQREKLSAFSFRHELTFIPDINELYVRFRLKDTERMQVLLDRAPDLALVRQIRAMGQEWGGRDMLDWITDLPEKTAREKVYKLVAYADYYKDKESIAIDYMMQALEITERTGQIEFILRQHDLLEIILKAVAKRPSVMLELLATQIADRIQKDNDLKKGGLPTPLTSRELEVVRHLATGKPISQIGSALHVSMNTMKTHLRNIYRKLEVDGRERAVEKARELFLV